MFTSRAEFRLRLRIDNADERLTPAGRRVGLVDDRRWRRFEEKEGQKGRILRWLQETKADVRRWPSLSVAQDYRPPLAIWLRRPEARISFLEPAIREFVGAPLASGLLATIETELKYGGYLAQQERQVERLRDSERRTIPHDFGYERVPGLSNEVRHKLNRVRPETLGQAARIPGVTPAAVAILDVYLNVAR